MAGGVSYDLETARTIARIRELLSKGYTLTAVANLSGWTKQNVWKLKSGLRHRKVSLPINELELRKPRNNRIMCRRCGNPPRIFTKSGLCIECELFELHKIGLVVILEPDDDQ